MNLDSIISIYFDRLSKLHHFPNGHFSDAIRNFAQVEQPHFLQRPVPTILFGSHIGHFLQTSSLCSTTSLLAMAKPDLANPAIDSANEANLLVGSFGSKMFASGCGVLCFIDYFCDLVV
jgi:hypothetical protein